MDQAVKGSILTLMLVVQAKKVHDLCPLVRAINIAIIIPHSKFKDNYRRKGITRPACSTVKRYVMQSTPYVS